MTKLLLGALGVLSLQVTPAEAQCNEQSLSWHPALGEFGTIFADANNDGLDDLFVFSSEVAHGPTLPWAISVWRNDHGWLTQPMLIHQHADGDPPSSGGNFVVDVTGDHLPDIVHVTAAQIFVRIATTSGQFQPKVAWTADPFTNGAHTFFADVDGDDRADAIVVTTNRIWVRRSTGTDFGPQESWWFWKRRFALGNWAFADVDGDGDADAVIYDASGVYVFRSNGTGFDPAVQWQVGVAGTLTFADADNNGSSDLIATTPTAVHVHRSNGASFGPGQLWFSGITSSTWLTTFARVFPSYGGGVDFVRVGVDRVRGFRNVGTAFDYLCY